MRLPGDHLLDVPVRVSVELGRAQTSLARAVGLSEGAILDLDRAPEDPVDLYVNGRHWGRGRLVLVDGDWAVRIESVEGVDAEVEQPSAAASGA